MFVQHVVETIRAGQPNAVSRSVVPLDGERASKALDDEDMSPAQANPVRPRYTKATVTSLPERVKSAISGNGNEHRRRRTVRGKRGGRVSIDECRNLRDPWRLGFVTPGPRGENITAGAAIMEVGWVRSSEEVE